MVLRNTAGLRQTWHLARPLTLLLFLLHLGILHNFLLVVLVGSARPFPRVLM